MSHSTTSKKSVQVYLIRAGDTDHYKIGISNRIKTRLETLQIGSPLPLEPIATCSLPNRDMAQAVECELHQTLSDFKISGEWYSLNESRLALVLSSFRVAERIADSAETVATRRVARRLRQMNENIKRMKQGEDEINTLWQEVWTRIAGASKPPLSLSYVQTVQLLGDYVWNLARNLNQYGIQEDGGACFRDWQAHHYVPVMEQRRARRRS